MQGKSIALVLGTAALVGFGVYLGRATTSTADRPAATTANEPVAVERPVAQRAPAPPPKVAPPAAHQDLEDEDPNVRAAAVKDVDDPKLVLEASRDRDLSVAYLATDKLGQLYAEGKVTAKEMLERVNDPNAPVRVRAAALSGFGKVPSPEAATVLVDLVARGELMQRRSAAVLLMHQDPAKAMPALIGALADEDYFVRSQAIESLKSRSRGRDFGADAAAWRAWWEVESRR